MSFTATINRFPSKIELDKPASEYGNRRSSQLHWRNSFLGLDGKVQDDYITKRASLNKRVTDNNKIESQIDALADLSHAEEITEIDGNVLAQLFLSGYAKLATRVEYLNRINVFPIADGDTGANMNACLKIPCRNLLLDPSPSVLRVASNMAADVLLNGQGNSGTILSHFYVCLAEEIRNLEDPACHEVLSIDAFAVCLAKIGEKMADAVPNPVEGTLVSVARDSCKNLMSHNQRYSNLKDLLHAWVDLAETELHATPEKLIVDGVKVLKEAGVKDSGAQGFYYTIEGMWQAANGKLPEASRPSLFQAATKKIDQCLRENLSDVVDDHGVCDSKYQFCTEAVVLLKDGVAKEDVLGAIDFQCYEISEAADGASIPSPPPPPPPPSRSLSRTCRCGIGPLGDSVACVSAPAKEGGNMLKVHIHTDEPQRFFDTLTPFSKNAILKKEKVEDMKAMRDMEHGSSIPSAEGLSEPNGSVDNAKFSIIGLSAMSLPPKIKAENEELLHTFPMFMVPADTREPIDIRYASDTDVLVALNQQRNPSTAVRMTSATSNPTQMKLELLAALSAGKPVLCFVFSTDQKKSAFGRNVLLAIDLLEPHQRAMVKVFVHGWASDGPFLMEAIECARNGTTIDEAIAVCEDLAQRSFGRIGFMDATMFRRSKAARPAMFPEGFEVPENHHCISGTPPGIRPNGTPLQERGRMCMAPIGMGTSLEDAYEKAAKHIASGLAPGQKLGNILLPCVGRPDHGHLFLRKLREEDIEIVGTPHVYNEGMIGAAFLSWGSINCTYKIIEA